MLEQSYDYILVIASILMAILASFTGFRLISDLDNLTIQLQKIRIAQSAFVFGCGIWSMHFIGMLSVSLPITCEYDVLPTIASALVAILVVGAAMLFLHFGERSQFRIIFSGVLTGLGIVTMHYLGMSAISGNCTLSYDPIGFLIAIGIGILLAVFAIQLAYMRPTITATILGSVGLGLAISAMHYSAMYFTNFSISDAFTLNSQPYFSQNLLAIAVTVITFLICGLFLLLAVPSSNAQSSNSNKLPFSASLASAQIDSVSGIDATEFDLKRTNLQDSEVTKQENEVLSRVNTNDHSSDEEITRLPFERNNAIQFLDTSSICFIKAEGHYSRLYELDTEYFCPWSISRVEKSISNKVFVRTHRSFLVNTSKIEGIKRDGDKAWCFFSNESKLDVPISRGRLKQIQKILGLKS